MTSFSFKRNLEKLVVRSRLSRLPERTSEGPRRVPRREGTRALGGERVLWFRASVLTNRPRHSLEAGPPHATCLGITLSSHTCPTDRLRELRAKAAEARARPLTGTEVAPRASSPTTAPRGFHCTRGLASAARHRRPRLWGSSGIPNPGVCGTARTVGSHSSAGCFREWFPSPHVAPCQPTSTTSFQTGPPRLSSQVSLQWIILYSSKR